MITILSLVLLNVTDTHILAITLTLPILTDIAIITKIARRN